MSYATIRTRVTNLHRVDQAIVTRTAGGQQDEAIQDALQRYGKDRPRVLIVAIPAEGSGVYEYSLSTAVTGWSNAYQVHRVQYPGGQAADNEIDENSYRVYRHPDGTWRLKFASNSPMEGISLGAGYDIWVTFTGPHIIREAVGEVTALDTVTDENPDDVDAFCHLAASLCLREAANFFADKQTNIGVETGDYQTYSREMAKRADDEEKLYRKGLGLDNDEDAAPCGAFVDWDSTQLGGEHYIFWRPGLT